MSPPSLLACPYMCIINITFDFHNMFPFQWYLKDLCRLKIDKVMKNYITLCQSNCPLVHSPNRWVKFDNHSPDAKITRRWWAYFAYPEFVHEHKSMHYLHVVAHITKVCIYLTFIVWISRWWCLLSWRTHVEHKKCNSACIPFMIGIILVWSNIAKTMAEERMSCWYQLELNIILILSIYSHMSTV